MKSEAFIAVIALFICSVHTINSQRRCRHSGEVAFGLFKKVIAVNPSNGKSPNDHRLQVQQRLFCTILLKSLKLFSIQSLITRSS